MPQLPRLRAAMALVLGLSLLFAACANEAPARGWSAPVVVSNSGDELVVVIQSAPGTLTELAITNTSTAERWTYPAKDDKTRLEAIYATPIVRAGRLIVAAYSRDLLALDLASGRPIEGWGGKLEGRVVADPVVVTPALMFVASDHAAVQPVDLDSGTIYPSKVEAGDRLYGAGLHVGNSVYYGTLDKRLFAVDATSAAPQWQVSTAPLLSGAASASSDVVIGSLDDRVRAYSAADGSERWSFAADEWFWATPLVAGGTVYAIDLDGRAFALDASTGAERWRSALARGNVRASPVLAGGVLVSATEAGLIFGLDPATGNEVWSTQASASRLLAAPTVVESGILFATDSGALLRVNPASGALETLYTHK
ncbi:MAG: PQQ-binding-like beta-propeller repeat protein [Dehalococcoidia bacterium]